MNPSKIDELRRRYLQRVYELSGANTGKGVRREQLDSELGISKDEDMAILNYLAGKGLASWHSAISASITAKGIDEVERIMAGSYAAKEFRVLKTIHETKHKASNGWVNLDDLIRELSDIPRRELFMILDDLENRKGLIGSIDQAVWMVPAGIEELELAERYPNRSTQYFPAQIINNYTVNVQGDNQGNIAQAGQGHTQTTNINTRSFDEAANRLLDLIDKSDLSPVNKITVKGDVQTLIQLSGLENTPEVKEAAISKLSILDKTLSLSADLYTLATPLMPLLFAPFQ